jgi:hypothetical protein
MSSKKQAASRAETPGDLHQTAWRYTLENRRLHRLRVSERLRLRKLALPSRKEIKRQQRKIHSQELHNFNSLPSIMAIKSKNEILPKHVARVEW